MTATSLTRDPEEALDQERTPHLSYSRINRYLTCPEQYRLYYVENLRPKIESASLVFGGLVHVALADFFREGVSPDDTFLREWENLKNIELRYNKRTSWEDLREKGKKVLEKFLAEELPKIQKVYGVEKKFHLAVTTMPLPFIGIVDLIAQVNGQATIIDFKTAASAYEEHEVTLSDQLTAYWLADPSADRVAYCVLTKTKEPVIHWHFAKRDADRLAEYLAKVRIVSEDIAAGKFYKRPGKHCGYCDFLPVCLEDKKEVQETLVRIA
jgi:CRISPR/Cas system-associated exonuclease Cas4 (RecB family)